MKPLRDKAREGRANSKGIPHLYVSTHRETALAEVRPWLGSLISVGQFKVLRELRIVNCTEDTPRRVYFFEIPPEKWDVTVWADIDRAFSRPVLPSDDTCEYAPTQIISDLFKAHKLDGVAYRSSLGKGHNLVFFDIEAADLVNCFLYELRGLDFSFEECANPYFLSKHIQKDSAPE